MRNHHPWVMLVLGGRGTGKSQTIGSILSTWPKELGSTLAIDPRAADPPHRENIGFWADRWRRSPPDQLEPDTALVACDEATLILTGRRDEKPLFRELFLRGRHMGPRGADGRARGISVLMGTQRPIDMPRTAFTQADRVVIHCLKGRTDLERLCELEGMDGTPAGAAALRMIPSLPAGFCVVWDARQGIFLPEVPGWRR